MKYKAVIFDLDGTLIDTLEDLRDSVNYALGSMGFAERSIDEIRSFVGNGIKRLVERSVPQNACEAEKQRCYELFKESYAVNYHNKTAPYEGMPELVELLKASGVKMAVVSNKSDAQTKLLCKENFGDAFQSVAGACEGVKLKPAPDAVLNAVKQLGVTKEQALYVGDSEVDAATAHNSCLAFAGVEWGFRSREVLVENNADFIVAKPAELAEIIV